MASLCAQGIITPASALMQPFSAKSIRRNKFLLGTHLLHLGRERQLWTKLPCLRAYTPSGIRTPDLLIASREYEPLHHSVVRSAQIYSINLHSTGIVCIIRSGLWECLPDLYLLVVSNGGSRFFELQVTLNAPRCHFG